MAQIDSPIPGGTAERPRRRIGLFLPYILLAALVLAWTVGWFVIRARAESEMDAWLAHEAQEGRQWTCADRSITGFPFRLELRCASVRFARSDGRFSLGPITAVVQIYDPRHLLLEATGPFRVEQGDLSADVSWNALEASFHGASDGFTRASVVLDAPKGVVNTPDPGPIDFAARHLELHARPTPGRFASDGAVDVSLRLAQAAVPRLNVLAGSTDPADIDLDTTIEQAAVLRTGTVANELETWRQAGGRLDVTRLSIAKGERRLQAKGAAALDPEHRPEGRFELRAVGLEALVGQVMGQRYGADKGALIGNLVGQFLGGLRRKEDGEGRAAETGTDALKPLPTLKLGDGRLMLGPFAVPNVVVPPLY
ncbi:DUF2125 domain-containing protein [Methylorubrum suomiense]|uniref:DUF2125 domain-containing protein n=1 Tax=Methylorubrum suomiense TaxID=144191 RepID=A0ABQ4UPC7_9HYPH|nr:MULTISPECIES: DUF2125 domain-containing protein [Methylobacteriaceae]GJE74055.1 hypothetical protein BGCPKDLD_0622 [Methylorubrum suomiense]